MPYYCTVPRCTSMAGKAKNVSFHQFPRDEELAKLWNRILKRGKPYTKYSKVCSLHFKPEDYTITSVGKNKGQWRTLRKDAIPSQNLPSESPVPYTRQSPGCWVPGQPALTDPMVQQQMAQAIYMQTMLAMQAAGASDSLAATDQPPQIPESTNPSPSSSSLTEIELLLRRDSEQKDITYKCHECSKCFKDPDVFILHKRTHKNSTQIEKENYSTNIQDREETLRANPILANLLKSSMRLEPETNMSNILTVENQIMAALASNMEAYIRTLSSMLSQARETEEKDDSDYENERETAKECEDTDEEHMCIDTSKETNQDNIEDDIQDGLKVNVTACVSPVDVKEDDTMKDDIDTENQSDVKSMNDEVIDKIEEASSNQGVESNETNQETLNHEYQVETTNNDRIESKDETVEEQNEVMVHKHENSNEIDMIEDIRRADEIKETIVDENHVNATSKVVDENHVSTDNAVNDFIDAKPNDAINENNSKDKIFDDKVDQANPECDRDVEPELIRIELEN
ncbi:uncharacterized protein LOC125240224 [Leguminivora glycinivorella]|uniref:uncharacterized protein LOC125240224 n=1 Tax=Leguminivora glycinivorella TaxID=1035111 RepID=UPI00200E7061|nr:uncharacterized protein LOC125240224 [Leguminivora glycinivorella]